MAGGGGDNMSRGGGASMARGGGGIMLGSRWGNVLHGFFVGLWGMCMASGKGLCCVCCCGGGCPGVRVLGAAGFGIVLSGVVVGARGGCEFGMGGRV